jgi:REP element-mobilizing transposase RayT
MQDGVSLALWYCLEMARPTRIEFPGALYHVTARGNERKAVFRDDADRAKYLERLSHYRDSLGFKLLAYCLMDNHVHLAIESGEAPLSRIMARLQSSYTQYFNRRHRRVGHLFQGRYKAFLVERDRYALGLLRYIHENPVKAAVARRPADYRWSSDRHYRTGAAPPWLDVDRLLSMLGRSRADAIRGYRRLMREEIEESYEGAESWSQLVKGDEEFADRVLQAAGEPPALRRGLGLDRVAREVAFVTRMEPAQMQGVGRGRRASQARLMVAWVAREVGGISLARTAKHFGRDSSTVARGIRSLEERMRTDRALKGQLNKVAERVGRGLA